jgi:hypothetical protein
MSAASGEKTERFPWLKKFRKAVIVLSAVAVVVLAFLSLLGRPQAAGFTRVGGATSVETAVDASRFWLTPPRHVVETWVGAKQPVMLWAAQCAVVLHAPLLFFFTDNPKKPPALVKATIWQWEQMAKHSVTPRWISTKAAGRACVGKRKRADLEWLSTLPSPLIQLSRVPQQDTLASTVVFAAPLAPWDPPDVAIGLALAAHMATPQHEVSLVVVPRYLEADPSLEQQLQRQSELVTGGIVLGQTPTLPQDTSILLRQSLSSPSRLDHLVNLSTPLGLAVAIIGLLGIGAAAAPAVIEPVLPLIQNKEKDDTRSTGPLPGFEETEKEGGGKVSTNSDAATGQAEHGPHATENDDWVRSLLGKEVTIRLLSGSTVTGIVERRQVTVVYSERDQAKRRSSFLPSRRTEDADLPGGAVLRIKDAKVEPEGGGPQQVAEFALVPVGRIELILSGIQSPRKPRTLSR